MRVSYLLLALISAAVNGPSEGPAKAVPQSPVEAVPAIPATEPGPAKAKAPASKEEKPLLLLDDEPADKAADKSIADNSRCHVCHLNFAQEELALKHAQTNVSCAVCHGASDAHIADESWASGGNGTAPEIIYTRDKIARGCMACHKAEQVFVQAEKHKPDLWLIAYEVKTCTDCHGKHRLPARKCKWK